MRSLDRTKARPSAMAIIGPQPMSAGRKPTGASLPSRSVHNWCAAKATVLASPLAGEAYAREAGGWNGPDAPSFVAPVAAEVGCAVVGDGFARLERFDMPPLSLVVFEVSVETQ